MLKSQRITLVFLMLALAFANCKKKDYKHYPFTDDRIREGMRIKNGSYFVYQDSVTGRMDSFIVVGYREQAKAPVDGERSTMEHFAYIMKSQNIPGFKFGIQTRAKEGDWADSFNGYGDTSEMVGAMPLLSFPFNIGESVRVLDGFSGTKAGYYPEFTIGGLTYREVYHMKMVSVTGDSLNESFYSIKSGLVRLAQKRNSLVRVWNLKRYNIIR